MLKSQISTLKFPVFSLRVEIKHLNVVNHKMFAKSFHNHACSVLAVDFTPTDVYVS